MDTASKNKNTSSSSRLSPHFALWAILCCILCCPYTIRNWVWCACR